MDNTREILVLMRTAVDADGKGVYKEKRPFVIQGC